MTMKKLFWFPKLLSLVFLLNLGICRVLGPAPSAMPTSTFVPTLTATSVPSVTPTRTLPPTATFTPTLTPTSTLTPTPSLLVQGQQSLPDTLPAINVDSAAQVSGLAEWREMTVTDITWLSGGRILVVATLQSISLYDVQTREVLRTLYPTAQNVIDIAISPGSKWLAAGSRRGSEKEGYNSSLELWYGTNWKPLGVIYDVPLALSSMAFSPNGKALVTAFASPIYEQNKIDFWSTLTWQITDTLQTGTALNIAFSPDNSVLAVTPDRYALRLWSMNKGDWLYTLRTSFTGAVTKVAFSPDGLTLASGHYDGSIRLWDVRTGQLLSIIYSQEVIESLAFGPDGRLLASGGSYENNLVRLWDTQSGILLNTLDGHPKGVGYLLFSPNGELLISASYDGTLRMWGIRP